MELDKTTIVLRQRSLLDLIDLSLVVLRTHWKPLLAYSAIGVLPLWLINFLILRPLTDYEAMLVIEFEMLDELPLRIRYVAFLTGLIFMQIPIAMLGVTYFLGQVLFEKQPSFREFGSTLVRMRAGIVLILGLFRFGILAWLMVALIRNNRSFDPVVEFFWLGMILCGTIAAVRAFRPFAPEILVLEQSPLRPPLTSTAGPSIAYASRSQSLHQQLSGDLVGRSLAMNLALMMMLTSITLGELFIGGIFFGVWTWEWWMDTILFPLNLWAVGLWATVFRFLSYLDCRTRLEDWELDLRMRAEARRWSGVTDR